MRTIKILALTDLHSHGNLELVEVKNLVNDEKIDIITLLGDLTTFGNVPLIKSILEQFDSIGKPVLYVPGNMDTEKATDIEFSNIIPIHGRMRNILGINFIGLGASNPTPFRVPFILTEKALNELLQNAIA
ncbi:MAG: metallophosphoesterase, partial [Asgard group archaeon]|nr:metallophosphoesterase [Asgard group archaeon]